MNGKTSLDSFEGLGHTCVARDELLGRYYLGYHSTMLLATAALKHTRNRATGLASNVKGKTMEDVIFSVITGIVDTKHPKTGEKLLSFDLPEGGGDLDAAGTADGSLVIVESKSWDSPTVSELEEELTKFENTLRYVEQNKKDLGFGDLTIVPLFFTPYPPYPRFNQITLVPSVLSVALLLATRFGIRKFELTEGSKTARAFFQSDVEERLFPLDVSESMTEIPPDTYRIQEGIVHEVSDDEISVSVCLNTGDVIPFDFDIKESMRSRLRDSSVEVGTMIRMLLLNLTGTWALVQLVDFKVSRSPDKTEGIEPEVLLKRSNPKSAGRLFIAQTWGGKEYDDIVGFASKWQIDIEKLVNRLKDSGLNPLTGMSAVLELETPDSTILQCDCGNVFRVPTAFLQKSEAGEAISNLRCPECDPSIATRLKQSGYEVTMPVDARELLHVIASLQKEKGSNQLSF